MEFTPAQFSHLDEQGRLHMVDVSAKEITRRDATACGKISLNAEALRLIEGNQIAKGNVLATARLAGIQAAKQTSSLIPLCHQLQLQHVEMELQPTADGIDITSTVRTIGRTGAEMEALTAASVAALTIYDMCKAVDKTMVIGNIRLVSKTKAPLTDA
ncbi:MAG: cyclic pyranopterin monophosphate synthase MoaC [Chthoniobacteraceae bacterium]